MKYLFQPTTITSLVFIRIFFGLSIFLDSLRYLYFGWVGKHQVLPLLHFTFEGFSQLASLASIATYIWLMTAISALCVAFGLFYRVTSILLFLGFSIIFFLEKAIYLNHFYLVFLISFCFMFLTPHHYFSIDVKLKPKIKNEWVPCWQLWILMFLIGIVYFYGGIAKIDPDWLTGNPLYFWLRNKFNFNGFYSLGVGMAWTGLLLDTVAPFLLLMRRTRLKVFIFLVIFHLLNAIIFSIGVFPFLSIALTVLFFPFPVISESKPVFKKDNKVLLFLTLFCLFNIVFPLRHHFYRGDVAWTEIGHRFSWRMKLRTKRAIEKIRFTIINKDTLEKFKVSKFDGLSNKQIYKMSVLPDMIVQYAHELKKGFKKKGILNIEVFAHTLVSLNHRSAQKLINDEINLLDYSTSNSDLEKIIVPLKEKRSLDSSINLMKKYRSY
jgi:hypothetical protein